jgi:hypothetical protein
MNKLFFLVPCFIFVLSVNTVANEASDCIILLLAECNKIYTECDNALTERDENYETELVHIREDMINFSLLLSKLNRLNFTNDSMHISYPIIKMLNYNLENINTDALYFISRQQYTDLFNSILLWGKDTRDILNYLLVITTNYLESDNNNWVIIGGENNTGDYAYMANSFVDTINDIRDRISLIENMTLDAVIFDYIPNIVIIRENLDESLKLVELLRFRGSQIFNKIIDMIIEKINEINSNTTDYNSRWFEDNIRQQSYLIDAFFVEILFCICLYI